MDKFIKIESVYEKLKPLYPYDWDITNKVIINNNTIVLESHIVGSGNDTIEYSVWSFDKVKETENSITISLDKLITDWC